MWDVWNYLISYLKNQSEYIGYILVFTVVFFVAIRLVQRKQSYVLTQLLFGGACSIIFVLTLFGREQRNYGTLEIPLSAYIIAFQEKDPEKILQIIMNIVMYIPFGFFLLCCFKKARRWHVALLVFFLLSLSIELIQGICSIGLFEFDDILNNVLGAIIGASVYKFVCKSCLKNKRERTKETRNE